MTNRNGVMVLGMALLAFHLVAQVSSPVPAQPRHQIGGRTPKGGRSGPKAKPAPRSKGQNPAIVQNYNDHARAEYRGDPEVHDINHPKKEK